MGKNLQKNEEHHKYQLRYLQCFSMIWPDPLVPRVHRVSSSPPSGWLRAGCASRPDQRTSRIGQSSQPTHIVGVGGSSPVAESARIVRGGATGGYRGIEPQAPAKPGNPKLARATLLFSWRYSHANIQIRSRLARQHSGHISLTCALSD